MSHQGHDTWIAAIPFKDGVDRRQSPRVPCAVRVRLGPPHQPAQTTLIAEDLSVGGVFIRCGEAVQVGARFSIELVLEHAEPVYVPEAEVLYNLGEGDRLGFGARFVSVSRDAMQRLVEQANFSSSISPRRIRDVSESMIVETTEELPPPRLRHTVAIDVRNAIAIPRVSDLRMASMLPQPELVEDTLLPENLEPEDIHDGIDWQPREVQARASRKMRRPMAVGMFCAAAALAIFAGTTLARRGSDAIARPVDAPPRVSSEVHQALTAPKAAPVVPVKVVEAADPEPVVATPVAKPVAKTEPTLASAIKKIEPSSTLILDVAPGSKVLRTYVFHAPERFVVDLVGQPSTPGVQKKDAGLGDPRFGKHPDFLRVVIDSDRMIDRGSVEKKGDRLQVTLIRR